MKASYFIMHILLLLFRLNCYKLCVNFVSNYCNLSFSWLPCFPWLWPLNNLEKARKDMIPYGLLLCNYNYNYMFIMSRSPILSKTKILN